MTDAVHGGQRGSAEPPRGGAETVRPSASVEPKPSAHRDLSAFGIDQPDWEARARRSLGPESAVPPALGSLAGYELVRLVARGAQGTVYEAREPRTGRRVAIKQIRTDHDDPRELAQLQRETSALAGFAHPNIVTLLSAPSGDGARSLVLEWVDGKSFDAWADDQWRRLASVDAARAVVRAVESIALGIAAAHARGVAHRDLKPSNVLVTPEGVPKILDFGIALELGATRAGRTSTFAGTPAWAAPEQVAGPISAIDGRVDVHALGLLLAAALSGVAPFDHSLPLEKLFRAIAHEPVVAPSRLRRGVPRELDLIVAKATEKDPAARYQTASALADDLGHFLRGEPISAHPPDLGYALRKFVRRHPVATTATIGALLALVGTSVIALRAAVTERQARDAAMASAAAADAERERVERMNDFFRALLSEVREREGAAGPASAREFLQLASDRLSAENLSAPSRVALHATLLDAYSALGEYRDAIREADAALALTAPDDSLGRARILSARGNAANRVGNGALARRSLEEALVTLDQYDALHPDRPAPRRFRIDVLDTLVDVHRKANRLVEARENLEVARSLVLASDANDRAWLLGYEAFILAEEGSIEAALDTAREAIVLGRNDAGVKPLTLGTVLHNAGMIANRLGRHAEALAFLEESIAIRRRHRESAAPIMNSRAQAAVALDKLGRTDEAIALLDSAGPVGGAASRLRNRTLGILLATRGLPEDTGRARTALIDGAGHFLGPDSGAALLASAALQALGALERTDAARTVTNPPEADPLEAVLANADAIRAAGSDPLLDGHVLGEMLAGLRRNRGPSTAVTDLGAQERANRDEILQRLRASLEGLERAGRGQSSDAVMTSLFLGVELCERGDALSAAEGRRLLESTAREAEALLGPSAAPTRRVGEALGRAWAAP